MGREAKEKMDACKLRKHRVLLFTKNKELSRHELKCFQVKL